MMESAVMRVILAAVGTLAIIASTSSFAQAQNETLQQAFNRCVKLAIERGYSTADLDGGTAHMAVRNFVIKCMQGQQQ
jgi:hypothetical protein